jgi:hypothetical protein
MAAYPVQGLLQASDGNFYGAFGPPPGDSPEQYDSLFQVTPTGTVTILSETSGGPASLLIEAADGNLYGTAAGGDETTSCPNGCGIVFQQTIPTNTNPRGSGTTEYVFDTILYPGTSSPALFVGSDKQLYGSFYQFVPPTSFTAYSASVEVGNPSGLLQAADGTFYGGASVGGANE